MARSPGNPSGSPQNLPFQRMPDRSRRRRRHQRALDIELLEDRTLLAVVPSLGANGILSIALTASNDAATVSKPNASTIQVSDGTTGTNFSLASVNSIAALGNGSSNQSITYTSAVNLTGPLSATGLSSVVLSGLYQVSSANLAASATIDIAAGATLSTRLIAAGGNPLTALSIGNSGALALTAPNIQVDNGASILANADSGFASADVTLNAADEANLNFALGLTGFKNTQTSTSITIGSATIKAKDVNVTGLSSTAKTVNLTQNLNDNRSIVMADVTGNGLQDLIVGNYDGPVEIYLNNGTSDPFNGVTPIALTNSSPTVGLAVADVTGNGLADLIVANQDAPTQLYLNNGNTNNPFGGVTPVNITTVNATSVAVADVNGDGRADLVVGVMSTDPNNLTPSQLFLNTGNERNPFNGTPINITGADYVTSLALANVNGDTLPDLVVGQGGLVSNGTTYGEPTRLFLNTGNPTNPFGGAPLDIGTTDVTTSAVAVANMNGDGHPDLIVGHDGEPTQLFLNTGVTNNPFGGTPQNITPSEPTTSLAVADVNGDGHLDLVVGNSGVPTQLYLNNGSSTTPFSGVTPQNITAQGDATASVALGDLNGDGHPDLFVGLNGDFPRVYLNNDTATPFTTVADTLNPEAELSYQANESAVLEFNLLVAAVLAQSESDITIGSDATIDADADVTLNAQAIANAQNTVIGVFLGGGYADSEPTANVSVGTGTNITAGGLFDMEALTQNTVNLLTIVPTDASPGTISFSYEKARSTSTADIAAGALVTAAAATIDAENTNLFSNSAKSLGFQAVGPASLGVAVAISDVQSAATASVHGSVRTSNDTTVDAQSINTNNVTSAIAAIINPIQDKEVIGPAVVGLGNALKGISLTDKIGQAIVAGKGSALGVAISAGVTVAQSLNTANAFVGSQGDIKAGGNVTVNARAEDNFKSNAAGTAGAADVASVGGGVDDSHTTNHANAYLDAGATVDAGLLLHIVSDADIPNPVQLFGVTFTPPADTTGTNDSNGTDRVNSGYATGPATSDSVLSWLEGLEQYVTTVLTGRLGSVATSYAQSGGEVQESATVGISGDVDIFTVDNASTAYIGEGAQVNQHLSSPDQDVQVEADTNIETINIAGQAELLNALELFGGAAGGKAGIGGSFESITYNNNAHAYIDANAKVSAGRDINVNANTFNYVLSLAQAGADSEALGVDGAMIFFNLNNDTEGWVDAGATLSAGHDVQVTAGSTLTDVVATGGIALGGDVGIGVSGSYNNITNTTKAFIANANGTTGPLGSVTAGDDITVAATSNQEIVSVGISGAFSSGMTEPTSTDGSGNSDPQAGVSVPASVAQQAAVSGKEFGIGLSGDVGLNFLAEDTEAFIQGAGPITAANELKVDATGTSLFIAAAGAVAYGNHVGIGGSAAIDNLQKTTKAYTQDVTIKAGNIVILATSVATLVAVAAGGGGSAESASVAGSVNLNSLSNDTEAYLGNGTNATTTTGGIAIDAANTLNTVTVAGVVAAGLGSAAVGAALDLGFYSSTVLAFIGGTASVSTAGNITVFASTDEPIRSVGAALAVAAEDGVGASGSAAAQVLTDDIEAYIGNGAVVHTNGSLFIDADDNTDLLVIGGSAAGGLSAGVGLSAGIGIASRTVKAYIGNNAQVSAGGNGSAVSDPEGSSLNGRGIILDATTEDENLVFAAGVGGGADAGLAASAVVDTQTSDTEAFIGQSARVATSQSVQIHAEEDTSYITVAGAFAGSADIGVGAAADVQVLSRTVKAYIDSSANVAAQGNVVLTADAPEKIIAVAAGLGVSGDAAGIAGSATVFTLTNDTEAFIGNGAIVSAQGSISLSALSDRDLIATAGAAGISASTGIGISNSTVVAEDTTLAFIGSNAQITALGMSSLAPVGVFIGQKDSSGNELTTPLHGLSLVAVSFLNELAIAAGAAGAGEVGVAGSATVNVLTEKTQATIGQSSTINTVNTGAGTAQDVNLLASDQTTIDDAAGSLAIGIGAAGIGAGADVEILSKDTEAYLAPSVNVNAAEHVLVNAVSSENLLSIAGSIGVGDSVGIAGAASVYTVALTTKAYIGAQDVVSAGGNVVLGADDESTLNMVDGALAGSPDFGGSVSGAVAIPIIAKTTQAYIDAGAIVDALGTKGATTVRTGTFTPSFKAPTSSDPVAPPAGNNSDATGDVFTNLRTVAPNTTNIRGVAVTATSTEAVMTVGASLGVSPLGIGISIVGAVDLPTTTTTAFIGQGAKVDTGAANSGTPNSSQSVLVGAGSDYYHLGIEGSANISAGAVNPGVDVLVSTNVAEAYIDQSAQVDARRDVTVQAGQSGTLISFVAGLSGGLLAVSGSASVVALDDTTYAYIGASAQVNAGGNVLVEANDTTGSFMVAGAAALGLGSAGVGGALGLNLITKDTEAFLDAGAVVNARGKDSTAMTVFDGTVDPNNGITSNKTANGLAVQAESSTGTFAIAVAGAAGEFGGLAGAVTVSVIQASTKAFIGSGAQVNVGVTDADPTQSVSVAAANDASIQGIDGAVGIAGVGGIAGGVDVGVIRDNTAAYIDTGAQVYANQDVDVFALSRESGNSLAVSAAAGAVGIAGAVSVYVLDGNLNAANSTDASSSLSSLSGNGATTGGYADQDASASAITQPMLNSYQTQNPNNANDPNTLIQTTVNSNATAAQGGGQSASQTSSDLSANLPTPTGTSASIRGSATVSAGRTVQVLANARADLNLVAGEGALGLVGVGGSVVVAHISSQTNAYVDPSATVAAATSDPTGNVIVNANFVEAGLGNDDTVEGKSYGGAGGLVALGAQVVVMNDDSQTNAYLNNGARITNANQVEVTASSTRKFNADSFGVEIGPLLAPGAAIAQVNVDGKTTAYSGTGVQIGEASGQSVNSLGIMASDTTDVATRARAIAAGIGAGTGNQADAGINPTIQASIGANSQVLVGQNVTVVAGSQDDASANLLGVQAGGVAVGVSLASATMSPIVDAFIDKGAQVAATSGSITIQATQDTTNGAQASGSATGVSAGTGEGANIAATAAAQVDSYVGSGATLDAGGTVTVDAAGANLASATASTLSVGVVLNVAAIFATAQASGNVNAYLDTGAVVGTAAQAAGGLVVEAVGTDQSAATVNLSGGGAFSGEGGNATAPRFRPSWPTSATTPRWM